MRYALRNLLFTVLFWSTGAHAWNSPGHESVGYLADQLLVGTNAAREVRRILGTNLKTAAVWADCAKGVSKSKGKFVYSVNPIYQECAPYETPAGQRLMIEYVKRNWGNCNPAPGEDPCHKQYHYTDVAIERDAYGDNLKGTSDHDVVHAITAAIIVLQGGDPPSPFQIANKKEALRLLSHLIGDIHQPLHVGAVYLDATGALCDPDNGNFDPKTSTRGGNVLLDGSHKLHAEWDGIPAKLTPDRLGKSAIDEARSVPVTDGLITTWSATWATETVHASKAAFDGVPFSAEDQSKHTWKVTLPAGYSVHRQALQREQILKAGGRLAQVLQALFP